MRDELAMGNERFYKHMRMLTDSGIVRKEQKRNGSRFGSTLYILNHNPCFQLAENPSTESPSTDDWRTGGTSAENLSTNNNSTNNNSINNNSHNKIHTVSKADRICSIMNSRKDAKGYRGRLRPEAGEKVIDDLMAAGIDFSVIEDAAEEVSKDIGCKWPDLKQAVLNKMGK